MPKILESPAAHQLKRKTKKRNEMQIGFTLAANTAYLHVIKEPYDSIIRRQNLQN